MEELGLSSPLMAEFEPALPLLCLQPLPLSSGQTMWTSQASEAFQSIQRPVRAHPPCGLTSFFFRSFPFSVVRGQQPPWEPSEAGDGPGVEVTEAAEARGAV